MPASICAKGIDICKNVEIIVWISQKFYANLEVKDGVLVNDNKLLSGSGL